MTDFNRRFQRLTHSFTQGLVLATVLLVSPVNAQQQSPDTPAIDPIATQLLQDLGQYMDAAGQYTFQANVEVDERSPRGQKVQYTSTIDVAVRQPDRMYARQAGDMSNRILWFDGNQFTLLDQNLDHYVSVDTPNTLAEGVPYLEDRGIVFPLSDFVTGNFYQGVIANVRTADYLGLHQVRGEMCHHLAFTQDNIDWQIWIADGYEIVPCKLVITYKNLPGEPQYTAYFSDWIFSPRLPERLFTPIVPNDATEVDFVPRQSP